MGIPPHSLYFFFHARSVSPPSLPSPLFYFTFLYNTTQPSALSRCFYLHSNSSNQVRFHNVLPNIHTIYPGLDGAKHRFTTYDPGRPDGPSGHLGDISQGCMDSPAAPRGVAPRRAGGFTPHAGGFTPRPGPGLEAEEIL